MKFAIWAKILLVVGLVFFMARAAFAKGGSAGAGEFKPSGIMGSVGYGYSIFSVTNPKANFKIDQGTYAAITGEKGLGNFNLYISLNISYLNTAGVANYSYTSLTNTYTASNIPFDLSMFEASLGLKWKIIDGFWIKPYVEAGGVAGSVQLKYRGLSNQAGFSGAQDYKSSDSLLENGQYLEGGIEITFSATYGLRLAGRQVSSQTKQFDTLGGETIQYSSQTYYLALLKAF